MAALTRFSNGTKKGSHGSSNTTITIQTFLLIFCSFLLGSILTAQYLIFPSQSGFPGDTASLSDNSFHNQHKSGIQPQPPVSPSQVQLSKSTHSFVSVLSGVKILVVIASFDFSQIPHLEEVLDAYHDISVSGALVDVTIHTTIAYPVSFIDLLNTRFIHPSFSLTIVIKPHSLRLHLVDCHRTTFYENVDNYDLFIYTEDDIRVTPTTVAAYLTETMRVKDLVQGSRTFKLSDFNIGIVRFEYNYPPNIIIDDNTRQATANVSRVYWEHSQSRPVISNAVIELRQESIAEEYFTMKNHHQGMFLATSEQLKEWKDRKNCDFANIRSRPGRGRQPTGGTQRVWMSSIMLYGKRHCGVQQLLPKNRFPTLTVLHLPNKNYRRVGKYRNRTFPNGNEVFIQPHESLLTSMELHIALRLQFPSSPQFPYRGVRMIDEVNTPRDRTPLLERRMREYEAFVNRGGVLSNDDAKKTALVETE